MTIIIPINPIFGSSTVLAMNLGYFLPTFALGLAVLTPVFGFTQFLSNQPTELLQVE